MTLTNRKRVFIREYLSCWNATEAALRAGYSERTARSQGSRLLTDVDIAQEIQLALNEKAMSADEVLMRLAQHARVDMGDFIDIENMSFGLNLKKAKELGLTHLIREVEDRVVMTSNKDGEETETHNLKIKLVDPKPALDTLAKYHGLLVDKTDITSDGKVIRVVGFDVDQL